MLFLHNDVKFWRGTFFPKTCESNVNESKLNNSIVCHPNELCSVFLLNVLTYCRKITWKFKKLGPNESTYSYNDTEICAECTLILTNQSANQNSRS